MDPASTTLFPSQTPCRRSCKLQLKKKLGSSFLTNCGLRSGRPSIQKDVKLVVRLLRSLYGHPLAGKLWEAFLSDKLRQIGGNRVMEWMSKSVHTQGCKLRGICFLPLEWIPCSPIYNFSLKQMLLQWFPKPRLRRSSPGRTHNCLKASCQWMGAKIFVKALASCSLDLQYRSFNDDSDSKVSQMLAMLTLCTPLQCRKRAEYLFWIIFMTASLSCSSIAGMRCSKRYSRVSWMCSVSPYKAAAKAITSAPGVDLATLLCFVLRQKTGKTIHRSWFQALCRWWTLLTKDKTRNRHHYICMEDWHMTIGDTSTTTIWDSIEIWHNPVKWTIIPLAPSRYVGCQSAYNKG